MAPEPFLGLGEGWRAHEKRDDGSIRQIGLDLVCTEGIDEADWKAVVENDRSLAKSLSKASGIAVPKGSFVTKQTLVRMMTLPTGLALSKLLASETFLAPQLSLILLSETARTLTVVHEAGFYHGLLGSEWVRVDAKGNVELVGFGSVQLPAVAHTIPTSPEQALGTSLDSRSDLFALGLLAWELFTGESPVNASTVEEVADRLLTRALPPLEPTDTELPRAVIEIIHQMTARRPADRPASMQQVEAILTEAVRARYSNQEKAQLALSEWWGLTQGDHDPTLLANGPSMEIQETESQTELGLDTQRIRNPAVGELRTVLADTSSGAKDDGIRLPSRSEVLRAVENTPTVESPPPKMVEPVTGNLDVHHLSLFAKKPSDRDVSGPDLTANEPTEPAVRPPRVAWWIGPIVFVALILILVGLRGLWLS